MKQKIFYGRKTRSSVSLHARRKELALALCVSLWMAGGSVASAAPVSINENTTINKDTTAGGDNTAPDGYSLDKDGGVTFTVENNGVVHSVFSEKNGNTVIVTGTGKISGSKKLSEDPNENETASIALGMTDNITTINGGTVAHSICGAFNKTSTGAVQKNFITINNGTVGDDPSGNGGSVYGGYNHYAGEDSGGASNNIVTLKENTTVKGSVYGGYTDKGDASVNQVIIKGGEGVNKVTITNNVNGGFTNKGTACQNVVTIENAAIAGTVYGGNSNGGKAGNNHVSLNNVTITPTDPNENYCYLFGGFSFDRQDVSHNTLTLSGVNEVNGKYNEFTGPYYANGSVLNFDTVTLECAKWGDHLLSAAGSFKNVGTIDASGLTFTNLDDFSNKSTTLIKTNTVAGSGAEGISTVNQITGPSSTITFKTPASNGVLLNVDLTGSVQKESDTALKYNATSLKLNPASSVNLDTWDGTTAVLKGWDRSEGTLEVSGSLFNPPTTDKDILTSTTANFFADVKIDPAIAYTGSERSVSASADNGVVFSLLRRDGVLVPENDKTKLVYKAGDKKLTGVDLTKWNSTKPAASVPANWEKQLGNGSITAGEGFAADAAPDTIADILTSATDNFFSTVQIDESIRFKDSMTCDDERYGVTLHGKQSRGVEAADEGKKLQFRAGIFTADSISFGEMIYGTARNAGAAGYRFGGVTAENIDASKLTFLNPEAVAPNTAATLLVANDTLTAALNDVSAPVSYSYSPVAGVTVDGTITGSLQKTADYKIQYAAEANRANKLTFTDVAWKDSGALLTRPANITFAGAAVDTTNINFTNIKSLDAGKKMTLVADFGNSVGTITGAKYKVGSTLEGDGKASLVGSDLIFTAETGTDGKPDVKPQAQTHNTVMGAEVGMAALSAGNDFVGAATEGLSLASNVGADGISSFAQMGGGSMRQETGSHIDVHTWNAILALGHQNKKERGTFQYGAFLEYGKGNYTTHDGDERGDGSMHYTGGGVLGKYTWASGFYGEMSLRAGSVHDDARNVLRDFRGMPYSYETSAPYMGFHLGVGKEIAFDDIHSLDVYGKYFYNRRNGVSFDAGGCYDLDAVTSQVLRVGARYTVKRDKWNFYGGLAYEHELDGVATGRADGVPIRGADTKGGSLRAEIGATMQPEEDSPWSLSLNMSGFAGEKQGFSGGVSVSFMF